jgi:hypothetical protein
MTPLTDKLELKRVNALTERALPKVTKLSTEAIPPCRPIERIDMLDPNVTDDKIDAEPLMRELPWWTDNPEPTRAKALKLTLLPKLKKSDTEALPPSREKDLTLIVEPALRKSTKDKLPPLFAFPRMLHPDPSRAKFRIDIALPRLT